MKQTLYINLYRAGIYHRQGKPNTANLHGGDVYTTAQAAYENAEPERGYITTVPFEADFPGVVLANPDNSVPDPLSATLSGKVPLLPYLVHDMSSEPSLEVGDGMFGVPSYDEWQRSHGNPSADYKPAHGGYPEVKPWPDRRPQGFQG